MDAGVAAKRSRRYIFEAVEASLRRLGTDFIDLYQVHLPDAETPGAAGGGGGGGGALEVRSYRVFRTGFPYPSAWTSRFQAVAPTRLS